MSNSPFLLLQEIYNEHPWRMLVCCIFLNCTTRKQVDLIREKFFEKYPEPQAVIDSTFEEMSTLIAPLGFKNRRTQTLVKFSKDWISKDWKEPCELHGIGRYAQDSWEIFQKRNYEIEVTDSVLKVYLNWIKNKN